MMWFRAGLVFAVGVVIAGCKDEPVACGDERSVTDLRTSAIVNGSAQWDPAVVSLSPGEALSIGALMERSGGGWAPMCTGTLVTTQLVVTAAHCVVSRGNVTDPSDLRFAIGADTNSAVLLTPNRIAADPDYNPRGDAEHDVAVLVFDIPVTTAVPAVIPIALNQDPLSQALIGERVQNVGFGCIDDDCLTDNTQRWWATEEIRVVTSIDVVADGNGVAGVCYGDSGGPVLRTFQGGSIRTFGILSWGDSQCGYQDHFVRTDTEQHFLAPFYDVGCGEVTATGQCAGTIATWCEGTTVLSSDCATTGQECGDDGAGRNRCVDTPDPCEGETPAGRCEGDTATWCDANAVVRVNCAQSGQTCGDDGSGSRRCIDLPSSCGSETYAGRCDQNIAIWCQDRAVNRVDCTATGQTCAADSTGQSRCADVLDRCGGETVAGRCDGAVAVWCDQGVQHRNDCTATGQVCRANESNEVRCMDVMTSACGDETLEGRCERDTLIWCEKGAIKQRRCAECGLSCVWSQSRLINDCE